MSKPVCYGDIIYLTLEDLILFSSGHFDPMVYLVSTQNLASKTFQNGLFQIYPNLSYKDTGRTDKLQNQLELLKTLNPDNILGITEIEKDIKTEKITNENREKKLMLLNEKILSESNGLPVAY